MKVSSKYLELIKSFPLREIRNDDDLKHAERVMHRLLDAKTLTAGEQDYLWTLGKLIEDYESRGHLIEPLPPGEMLAELIESRGVTQTEVAAGSHISVSTISELISGKREFTRIHIERLCVYFGVGPAAFFQTHPA